MELRHLRYFVAVAETEHVTRAAARLCMQQAPLSQQIMNLERELGVALFTRSPRKLRLNAAGKVLLSDVRRILADLDGAVRRVQAFDRGGEGVLRLGFTSSASMHRITREMVEAFRLRCPMVAISVEEGANHDLLRMLEEERLDIAFVRTGAQRYPSLTTYRVDMEPMLLALPSAHRLTQGTEDLPLTALDGEDVVFYRQANSSGIADLLAQSLAAQGIQVKVVAETQRIISAIQMASMGIGLAVVPLSMASFHLGTVAYRRLDPLRSFRVPLHAATRRHSESQTIRRFLDFLPEEVAC